MIENKPIQIKIPGALKSGIRLLMKKRVIKTYSDYVLVLIKNDFKRQGIKLNSEVE